MSLDPARIHAQFLDIAAGVGPRLVVGLSRAGPVDFPKRGRERLSWFLCRTVNAQLLSAAAARSIWGRVEDLSKARAVAIPDLFTPRNTEAVRACGVSRSKAKTMIGIRAAERAGKLDARAIRRMSVEARTAHLSQLWGIGQWTCDIASLFYCREPDMWPEGDVAAQRMFRALIGRRKPDRTAARFVPYRSYLALAMWRLVGIDRNEQSL